LFFSRIGKVFHFHKKGAVTKAPKSLKKRVKNGIIKSRKTQCLCEFERF